MTVENRTVAVARLIRPLPFQVPQHGGAKEAERRDAEAGQELAGQHGGGAAGA